MQYDDIVDSMLQWAIDHPRVNALWVEGDSSTEVRRPYPALRLHVATDEPSFEALLQELPSAIEKQCEGSRLGGTEDVPRSAKQLDLLSGALQWTLVLERTSLLAKRPRSHVACLFDRTGHVTEVMDFSSRA